MPPPPSPLGLSHLRGAISPGVSSSSNAVSGWSGSGFAHAGSRWQETRPALSWLLSTFTAGDVTKGRSKPKLPGALGGSEPRARTWLAK